MRARTFRHILLSYMAAEAQIRGGRAAARRTGHAACGTAGEPRNAPATHLHGFLSRDGMDPAELLATARQEVIGYDGELLAGWAIGIDRLDGARFVVRLDDGRSLCTHAQWWWPRGSAMSSEIPGPRERWGQDVHVCPYCHGYEVRDSPCSRGLVRRIA